MKRLIVCLGLGVSLLSGCSDTQVVRTAAGLSGTYDLALVGRYLFVTSSDRNELRVLDLESSPRDFIRAPNPIEPLSIPVLERPFQLTRDVRYAVQGEAQGQEIAGPYVYVRSAGAQEISVVAADPAYFKEVKRLRGRGFVTAFAARGPLGEGGSSTLYFATQDAAGATLHRLELPGPEQLAAIDQAALPERTLSLPGETVTALLVLPATPENPEQDHLVVATRKVSASAQKGDRTFRLDVTSGQELAEYQFGAPVRLLATHPRTELTSEEWEPCRFDPLTDPPNKVPDPLAAGQYVFAVLDESFCGGQPACSGVLAVDAASGERAKDSTGLPMLPIAGGSVLPTGLTLAPRADVLIRCKDNTRSVQKRLLVGIVPSSSGQITLFDAARRQQFDFNPEGPSVASRVMVAPTGEVRLITQGKLEEAIEVVTKDGVTRSDTYRIVSEGILPGLGGQTRSAATVDCVREPGKCFFTVNARAAEELRIPGAAPGETKLAGYVLLEGDGGLVCPQNLEVNALLPTSNPRLAELETAGPLPAECAELPRFSVRTSGDRPFVVLRDRTGYVGRMADGEAGSLTVLGDPLFHPPGFDPNTENVQVRLTLKLDQQSILPRPTRGDQYVVTVQSAFEPFVFRADTSTLAAGLTAYRLPGPVVYAQVGESDLAYIAYPSADGILQVNLGAILDGADNATGLVPFE